MPNSICKTNRNSPTQGHPCLAFWSRLLDRPFWGTNAIAFVDINLPVGNEQALKNNHSTLHS